MPLMPMFCPKELKVCKVKVTKSKWMAIVIPNEVRNLPKQAEMPVNKNLEVAEEYAWGDSSRWSE